MRISRLLSLFVLLLPLHTFAEIYDVSTTAELRAALASAAEAGGDNTIRLAAGTYSTQDDGGGTFEFNSAMDGKLTLDGNSTKEVSLDGSFQEQILFISRYGTGSFDVLLNNVTFQNSAAEFNAAVQLSNLISEIEIRAVRFQGNGNGSLSINTPNDDLDVVIESSEFLSNADENGYAAVFAQVGGGSVKINSSDFADNSGNALIAVRYRGSLRISNSTFRQNDFLNCNRCSDSAIQANSVQSSVFVGNTFDSVLLSVDEMLNSIFEANVYSGNEVGYTVNNGFSMSLGTGVANNQFIDSGTVFVSTTNPLANNLFSNTRLWANDENGLPNISNNIFINNEEADLVGEFYAVNLNNNLIDIDRVQEIQISGSGNLSPDTPLGFVKAEEGDYRLTSSSGLIDAGTTDPELAYITDYDYTGTTARVIGASIDIGPYEYDGEAPADSDGDGDGLNDNTDNCPSIANEDQADNDSDGEGDVCDSDDDNDGTNDEDDAFPFDASESLDTDGDGIGNNEDYDDDADGILDSFDNAPLVVNAIVVDSDNDGVIDSVDAYPNDPTKQYLGSGDLDGDGYSNDEEVDYCTNPFDKNSQPELSGLSMPMIHLLTEQ